jgi:hypothetical protein
MPITIRSLAIRDDRGIAATPQAARAAHQPDEASSGRNISLGMIGLALVARFVRDPRTYQTAVVAAIAVAALAGLGKAGRTSSFARLAAWDQRRRENELRRLKRLKDRHA